MLRALISATALGFVVAVETTPADSRVTIAVAVITTLGGVAVAAVASARSNRRAIGRHAEDSSTILTRLERKVDEDHDATLRNGQKLDDLRAWADVHEEHAQQRDTRIARLEAWWEMHRGDGR